MPIFPVLFPPAMNSPSVFVAAPVTKVECCLCPPFLSARPPSTHVPCREANVLADRIVRRSLFAVAQGSSVTLRYVTLRYVVDAVGRPA